MTPKGYPLHHAKLKTSPIYSKSKRLQKRNLGTLLMRHVLVLRVGQILGKIYKFLVRVSNNLGMASWHVT